MDYELSLSHPVLGSSSGLGQNMPILENDSLYSVWMAHPDGSINFVSSIQPLKYSATLGMSIPRSVIGCRSTSSSSGVMSLEPSPSAPLACSRAIPTSRRVILSLLGFLILRLLIGTRWSRLRPTNDKPTQCLVELWREISSLGSPVLLTEEPMPGELGMQRNGLSSSI